MQLAGQPMKYSKKKMNGRSERIAHLLKELPALASVIENFRRQPHNGAAEDDLFDACVACWTALRIYRREALAVPEIAARDDQGLLMQIWR